jgi:DNA-3-methyladenine glycosylase II
VPRPSAGTTTLPVDAGPGPTAVLRDSDPVMGAIVADHGPLDMEERRRGRPSDAYGALLRSIVGQQLSTKAARSIYQRLVDRYDGHAPTPAQILEADPEDIRSVGLSRAKVAYLRDLAEHVEDGELRLDLLPELDDAEVVAELTAIKGLGLWTAQMFLMFHLGRPDVLPVGDLGIRRAVERAYELDEVPDPATLERIAMPWRPYRTLACLYLWRSLDNEPG